MRFLYREYYCEFCDSFNVDTSACACIYQTVVLFDNNGISETLMCLDKLAGANTTILIYRSCRIRETYILGDRKVDNLFHTRLYIIVVDIDSQLAPRPVLYSLLSEFLIVCLSERCVNFPFAMPAEFIRAMRIEEVIDIAASLVSLSRTDRPKAKI